jgi:hypothetical protein
MKKVLFFLSFLMVINFANAQSYTYDSIANLDFGWYLINVKNLAELHDGNIVSNFSLTELDDQGQLLDDYGELLVKLSPSSGIMDSVFIADNFANHYLIGRNPQGEDNLFIKIVRDFENNQTNLLIRHFDDNLYFDEANDIIVPLEDTIIQTSERYLFENDENIILWYGLSPSLDMFPITPIMIRARLDGTILDRVELPDTLIGPRSGWWNDLKVFNDSPREYAWPQGEFGTEWGEYGYFVVDSLFQLKKYVRIEHDFDPNYHADFGGLSPFLPLDEFTYLVSSRYYNNDFNHYGDNGVRITKYDKTTDENLGSVGFKTKPLGPNQGFTTCAWPRDLAKSSDGYIYYLYSSADALAPTGYYVGVAKLDSDLNIIWHRYCMGPSFVHRPELILCLEDGGIVVGGYENGTVTGHIPPKPFFLFFQDNGNSTPETEAFIRPYLFYPNPTQDQLHLQYSPDVQPKTIELYDLQGRLVHKQSKDLENVDMQGLALGQYLMKVMLEDGKSYTDKVVKE